MGREKANSFRAEGSLRGAAVSLALAAAVSFATPLAVQGQQAAAQTQLQAVRAERVGVSLARLDRLTRNFENEIAAKRLPGAVVMVARRGQIVYAHAFGSRDPASPDPMRLDSIFRIYSMTKPMVSVAAMILMEEGVLQPADPVSKWLPAFKDMKVLEGNQTVAATRVMTVQDLLRHTAGFGYGEIDPAPAFREALKEAGLYKPGVLQYDVRNQTPHEFTDRLAKVPLLFEPGTAWEYSLSTDVLGRVVEEASGKKLSEFLSERIFRPLRMEDTAFFVPDTKKSRLTQPFDKDPVSGRPFQLVDVSKPPSMDSGGMGSVSTAPDYLRFTQMLLNGGILDGRRILSRTSVRYMTSDHLGGRIPPAASPGGNILNPAQHTFGLGFAVRLNDGLANSQGSAGEYFWSGYSGTYFWIDPKEQLTVVMMTQSPGALRDFYRNLVRQLVYQAIAD